MSKKEKGFTLIELLVVVAIIGTLSGLVLVAMGGARKKARDSVRQSDMRQVVSGQEMYYGDHEYYLQHAGPTAGTPEIPSYLRAIHDPLCPDGDESSHTDYVWLPNDVLDLDCDGGTYDVDLGQWFCAYALLEDNPTVAGCSSTTYVASSHKGTMFVCDAVPNTSDAVGGCTCFIEY